MRGQALDRARQEKMAREAQLRKKKADEIKRKKELKKRMMDEAEEQRRKEFLAEQHERVMNVHSRPVFCLDVRDAIAWRASVCVSVR